MLTLIFLYFFLGSLEVNCRITLFSRYIYIHQNGKRKSRLVNFKSSSLKVGLSAIEDEKKKKEKRVNFERKFFTRFP